MVTDVIIILAGLALLAVTAWAWRGRSEAARWWVEVQTTRRLMLGVAPALGVLVLCGGTLALVENYSKPVFDSIALVVALPMLAAMALVLISVIGLVPKWWGPKWYRDEIKDERGGPFDGW